MTATTARLGSFHRFEVRHSGRLLELRASQEHATTRGTADRTLRDASGKPCGESPRRGRIRSFSARSRRRLFKTCAAVPWSRYGSAVLFMTLTYPGAGYPNDSAEAKRHLDLLRKRWARKWGSCAYVWKQEFQRRGVIHFHLGVMVKDELDYAEWQQLRSWLGTTWYRIVDSGDPRHLQAGVQLDRATGNLAAYFAKYASSKGSKEYQHECPAEWPTAGRWWGVRGVEHDWHTARLGAGQWMRMRRILRRALQARLRRRVKSDGRIQGAWLIGQSEGVWSALLPQLVGT